MATPVIDRPTTTPPDPWATAPVAVGHGRHRMWWVVVPAVVLIAAGALALIVGRQAPATSPSTPAGPELVPQQAAASVPFAVSMEVTEVASMDNDGLFGHGTVIPEDAVDTAVREVEQVLRTYLDAQFVTAETRFSDHPMADLLSRHALAAVPTDDLDGLGVLGVPVRHVRAEPVAVTARVLTSRSDAAVVVVRYEARAEVTTEHGGTAPLQQRATMVFVPESGRWRARAVTAALDLPLPAGEVAR
jgi:hypothetical protein